MNKGLSGISVFLAGIIYTAIFFLYSYPLVLHFNEGLISQYLQNGDVNQYIWNAFNFQHQLSAHQNFFDTEFIFAPLHTSMLMHTYTPFMSIFYLFIHNIFTSINTVLLLSFLISAIGAMLLCYRFVQDYGLSFFTGFVFAFCPYKTVHLGEHYHLMLTATIPFVIILILKLTNGWREKKKMNVWYMLLLFFLFVIVFLSDYYQLFYLIYFAFFYVALLYWQPLTYNWRNYKPWFWLAGIIAGIHILVHILKISKVDDKGALWWGGDFISFIIPPLNSRWMESAFSGSVYDSHIYNAPTTSDNVLFMGYFFLLAMLLVFFLTFKNKIKIPKDIAYLTLIVLLFLMVAIPTGKFAGKNLLNMPTAILHYVPFFNNLRCPTRIAMLIMLLLPIIFSYALWKLKEHYKLSKKLSFLISFILIIITLIEYQPLSYSVLTAKSLIQPIYEDVKKEKGETLMLIPFGLRDGMISYGTMNTNDLFIQTYHQKKMLGGYISRLDKQVISFYTQDSICRAIMKMETDTTYHPLFPDAQASELFLKKFKVDMILIKPEYRHTYLEKYVLHLLEGIPYGMKIKDEYLLLSLK